MDACQNWRADHAPSPKGETIRAPNLGFAISCPSRPDPGRPASSP